MPQVIAVMVAGAGLYAGFRWASRAWQQAKDAARRMEEHTAEATQQARVPKDLGTLELDHETGVYRPRAR